MNKSNSLESWDNMVQVQMAILKQVSCTDKQRNPVNSEELLVLCPFRSL